MVWSKKCKCENHSESKETLQKKRRDTKKIALIVGALAIVIVVGVVVFCLLGNSKIDRRLLGTWEIESYGDTLTFYKDGTCTKESMGEDYKYDYEVDDNVLKVMDYNMGEPGMLQFNHRYTFGTTEDGKEYVILESTESHLEYQYYLYKVNE